MSVRVLEELDDIGESKNILYRDLTETIIKIKQILIEKMIGKSFQLKNQLYRNAIKLITI